MNLFLFAIYDFIVVNTWYLNIHMNSKTLNL